MSGVIPMIAPLVLFLGLGWVVLLVAAPFLPPAAAAITYVLGSRICHQISERSFHLGGAQLPVCARCLGIYAGIAAGAVFAILRGGAAGLRRARLRWPHPRITIAVGALPTLVTVVAEWSGAWQTSNAARALAGGPLGAAVAVVVIGALATVHYGECTPRPPIGPDRPRSHI